MRQVALPLLLAAATVCGAPEPAPAPAGIAWFATWTSALAEAARTKRPILLVSAAPQCRHISGMW